VRRDGDGYRVDLGRAETGIFFAIELDRANQIEMVKQFAVLGHKFARQVGRERPLWCALRTRVGHRARSEKCHFSDIGFLVNVRFARHKRTFPQSRFWTPRGDAEGVEFEACGPLQLPSQKQAELEGLKLVQNRPSSPAEVCHASNRNEGSRL
jgi:hypothetical protein